VSREQFAGRNALNLPGRRALFSSTGALLLISIVAPGKGRSSRAEATLAKEVRDVPVMLPSFGVFDSLAFRVYGGQCPGTFSS
jgi:hypothetical protein